MRLLCDGIRKNPGGRGAQGSAEASPCAWKLPQATCVSSAGQPFILSCMCCFFPCRAVSSGTCLPGAWFLGFSRQQGEPHRTLLPAHQGPPPFKYPPVGRSLRETALRAARLSPSEQLLPELLVPAPRLSAMPAPPSPP